MLALERLPLLLYAIIPHYAHEYGIIGTEGLLHRHLAPLHAELRSDATEYGLSRPSSNVRIRNHFMTTYMLDLQEYFTIDDVFDSGATRCCLCSVAYEVCWM